MDTEEISEWLETYANIIDWDQFDSWAETVEGKPGYEWLDEVFEQWDEEEVEDEIDWDVMAKSIEEKKHNVTAENAAEWLLTNQKKIDWHEFKEWYDDVID